MFNFTSSPPLSLYVHFPWCVRKCPYCDFNSHPVRQRIPEEEYILALIRDLEIELPRIWGRRICSIYLGGGTPSLFSGTAISQLLSELRARLTLHPDAEITLEANPGTADEINFSDYREAGVNRLSIGVQSFNDTLLQAIGRIHNADEARRAVAKAQAQNFNINLDLMFALPGQDIQQALADLNTAMSLEPDHISLYQLTIEANTAFHANSPVLPDDDTAWTLQEELRKGLKDGGYRQYEISAYALKGRESRHNLNYWTFGDYLGIGAGAHGKLSDTAGITRRWKIKHPRDYIKHAGSDKATAGEERLGEGATSLEFMMNALRLINGFRLSLYTERTGLSLNTIAVQLERAEKDGLIERNAVQLRPTELGLRYLNNTLSLFMDD